MVTNTWPVECCPSCLESDSIPLGESDRLCLQCRHEWNPATTTGPIEREQHGYEIPGAIVPVAEMVRARPKTLAEQVADARELLVGRRVVWFSEGWDMTVIEITDDGVAILEDDGGLRLPADPDEFALIEESVLEDDVVAALGAVDLQAAAMVVRAAVASFATVAGTRVLGMPPEGYLPHDVEAMTVIEHGAAYAVATVALARGIPTEELEEIAETLDDAARAAEEATGL